MPFWAHPAPFPPPGLHAVCRSYVDLNQATVADLVLARQLTCLHLHENAQFSRAKRLLHCIDQGSLFCRMALCCARARSCRWIAPDPLQMSKSPRNTHHADQQGKHSSEAFNLFSPSITMCSFTGVPLFLRSISWACISSEEEIKIKTSSVLCSHKTGGQRPHPLAGWCC